MTSFEGRRLWNEKEGCVENVLGTIESAPFLSFFLSFFLFLSLSLFLVFLFHFLPESFISFRAEGSNIPFFLETEAEPSVHQSTSRSDQTQQRAIHLRLTIDPIQGMHLYTWVVNACLCLCLWLRWSKEEPNRSTGVDRYNTKATKYWWWSSRIVEWINVLVMVPETLYYCLFVLFYVLCTWSLSPPCTYRTIVFVSFTKDKRVALNNPLETVKKYIIDDICVSFAPPISDPSQTHR